jgi:hypothetical protein
MSVGLDHRPSLSRHDRVVQPVVGQSLVASPCVHPACLRSFADLRASRLYGARAASLDAAQATAGPRRCRAADFPERPITRHEGRLSVGEQGNTGHPTDRVRAANRTRPNISLRNRLARLRPHRPHASAGSKPLPSNSFEARNATFLLALILICSPVAGLRPIRAARLRT